MKFTVHPPTRDPAKLAAQKVEAERIFARAREKELAESSSGAAADEADREQFVEKLRGVE